MRAVANCDGAPFFARKTAPGRQPCKDELAGTPGFLIATDAADCRAEVTMTDILILGFY
ncbi:hypothetical protein P3W53_26055 [Pseudomonas denitrificans (nom. rej.)]|nr:hypothetical protein [Pseudomonas denitrificans (nom. rej.)]